MQKDPLAAPHVQQRQQQRMAGTGPVLTDCTIMVDAANSSAPVSSSSYSDVSCVASETPVAPPQPPPSARPRTYYVDWLRVFLTVLVLLHHCVCSYLTKTAWQAKKGDTSLWLLTQLFVNGNQAYFMTLFFFLSGLYVPGSYKRKGPVQFLGDRTLRLVLPCLVYSLLFAPLMIWWRQLALEEPGATLGGAYRGWLKPGWPTTYILPTGPPWFIWMLWCFNVAYVILRVLCDCAVRCFRRSSGRDTAESDVEGAADRGGWKLKQQKKGLVGSQMDLRGVGVSSTAAGAAAPSVPARRGEYSTAQCLFGGAGLITVLFVLCYAVRLLNMMEWDLRPATFVQRGPFVAFMPDFFVVYVIAFGLGTFSGPSGWDVLAKLPRGWSPWLLSISGIWWLLGGWLLGITMHPMLSLQRGSTAFFLAWLLRTFVEQSFAVVWSVGLLVLFREAFNHRPGLLGRQVVNGAYGAYIIHPVLILLLSWGLMDVAQAFPSSVVSAVVISPPTVIGSWVLAAAVRALPGADRVL